MIYDALLMLSGGKDSCSLALTLFKEKKNILLFTNDTGFLNDTAKANIEKIKTITKFDSVIVSDYVSYHKMLVDNYFQNLGLRMELDLCHHCTKITDYTAQLEAKKRGINVIYNGHTNLQMGLASKSKLRNIKIVNGVEWRVPFFKKYDFNEIKKELDFYNIDWKPINTNCIPIKDIIQEEFRRSKINPFGLELNSFIKSRSFSETEVNKINSFCKCSLKRLHKDGYFQKTKITNIQIKNIYSINKNKI